MDPLVNEEGEGPSDHGCSSGLCINLTLVMGALVIVLVSKFLCEGADGAEYDRSYVYSLFNLIINNIYIYIKLT